MFKSRVAVLHHNRTMWKDWGKNEMVVKIFAGLDQFSPSVSRFAVAEKEVTRPLHCFFRWASLWRPRFASWTNSTFSWIRRFESWRSKLWFIPRKWCSTANSSSSPLRISLALTRIPSLKYSSFSLRKDTTEWVQPNKHFNVAVLHLFN